MFDHVAIRASDGAASQRFYDSVLAPLGGPGNFFVVQTTPEHPVTRGLHAGFFAPSRDVVDEFWRAGTEAGYRDDGAPGLRPEYSEDYYGAFLLDPDGNSVEAVTHGSTRPTGSVDHVWLRATDLAAAQAFYETIAPYAGLRVGREGADRVRFDAGAGSLSFVPGQPPTEHLHFAFSATENAAVDAFHRAAIDAGYRDNGAPGERLGVPPGLLRRLRARPRRQ